MRVIVFLLLGIFCSSLWGAEAALETSSSVVLDGRTSKGDFFKWQVVPLGASSKEFTLIPVGEGNRRVILVAAKGKYQIILAVSDEKGVDLIDFEVEVGGDNNKPNPNPNPNPNPDDPINPDPPKPYKPDFSNSTLGISQRIYDRGLTVNNYIQDSSKLGDEIVGLASEIAEGKYQNVGEIQNATKLTVASVLSETRLKDWEPVLGAASLGKELSDLAKAGKLSSNKEISDAYREVGIGLKALRSK